MKFKFKKKLYFIAEAGVNHENSLSLAEKIIKQAADGGASAVKFQTYKAELLASKKSPAYWDTSKVKVKSQFKLFKKFDKFNKDKVLSINFDEISREISILYKDEINYAFSNIIQNAIQHSKNKVYITISRNLKELSIKITDDGNGFSRDILDKLGEPYITKTKKGMGLGIFIAKNLIENVNGKMRFYNSSNGNAVVEILFNESILIT